VVIKNMVLPTSQVNRNSQDSNSWIEPVCGPIEKENLYLRNRGIGRGIVHRESNCRMPWKFYEVFGNGGSNVKNRRITMTIALTSLRFASLR
jgi:hypothetical protein